MVGRMLSVHYSSFIGSNVVFVSFFQVGGVRTMGVKVESLEAAEKA